MATLKELLALARDPGENGLPDTIYDDMEFAYDDEVAAFAQERDGANAKIQSLESDVSRLKTHNYDLLMSTANNDDDGGSEGEGDGDSGEGSESDDSKTVDDLFG